MSTKYTITIDRTEVVKEDTNSWEKTGKKNADGSDEYGVVVIPNKPVTKKETVYMQTTTKEVEVKPLIDAFNAAIKAY